MFCRQNNPIIPSARVTGGETRGRPARYAWAAKKCLATTESGSSAVAKAQQRSSPRAADQMVKADRRHSGGGSLRRWITQAGGSHAESGQTEYIMLLVICLDFLHFCISAFSVSTSSAHAHTHAHVLCIAVSAGVRLVSAKEPY